MPNDEADKALCYPQLSVFPVDATQDPTEELTLTPARLPRRIRTLGALGVATRVIGPPVFPYVILRQPFTAASLTGIDARTVRVFRIERRSLSCLPVWDSGINVGLGFVWSRIRRPGLYAPLGLPRDRLLFEMIRALARARRYRDPQTSGESAELAYQIFRPFLEAGDEEREKIEELRGLLARLEIGTSTGIFLPGEIRIGQGAVPQPFPLPGDISFQELQTWLRDWLCAPDISPAGLPEETLNFPLERPDDAEPPWLILPARPLPRPVPLPCPGEPLPIPWPPSELGLPEDRMRVDERLLEVLESFPHITSPEILCWVYSRSWWMHHRNAAHTGDAHCSAIRRTNVQSLIQRSKIRLDGPLVSIPCVVAGKVYIGSSTRPDGSGGTLFKVDLVTGHIDARFCFEGEGDQRTPHAGVGSSPAVAEGKVYFSALTGKVYCLDATTLACRWVTDLRHADCRQNQPVDHGAVLANGWSSPLVVNNRVYVACGEGESPEKSYGFVYCLDAATGKVIWLFCTSQFDVNVDNKPNVIPPSSFDPKKFACPLPPMFTLAADDPLQYGASPWSAPAYSEVLNRIYIGTGNAVLDDPLPDPPYSSGLLSLDATTGDFKGFFQPSPSDSYREQHDLDVDVPAGPMLFIRCGIQYVCFGSKNGAFFILDADTMKVADCERARRQLLPYKSTGEPFPEVDPGPFPHENKSGVLGTAALHSHLGHIFIGLGGYGEFAIDHKTTPFVRAIDWVTLADAWPTKGTDPPRYRAAQPPIYCTAREAGMSSPAVVNDVVFVATTKPALYAFDAETGLCLWEAPGITPAPESYAFGPAIYGNFVVNGITDANQGGGQLYIYSLREASGR